jgi:hypothetical protein
MLLNVFAKKISITRKDLPGQFKLDAEEKRWMKKQNNVEIFRDEECKIPFCTFLYDSKSKPTKRNKYITLNCYRWCLVWL